MKRFLAKAIFTLCMFSSLVHASANDDIYNALKYTPTQIEKEALGLINAERESRGIHPLSWNNQLFEAARGHSEDMAAKNYFSHTSLDGRTFVQRIDATGYEYRRPPVFWTLN